MVQVTGLAVSARHPYMFSGSLDKEVKCWDLEYNKVCHCIPCCLPTAMSAAGLRFNFSSL